MPTFAEDDRPLDSLGRPKRRSRYPIVTTVKLSKQATVDLAAMAEERDTKPATIMRRAIMKEIYIHKAKKEQKL